MKPRKGSHAYYFGKERYEEAVSFMEKLHTYRNILGQQIFSGASCFSVPEKPLKPNSGYWKLAFGRNRLNEIQEKK